ncbi:FimV/HubP family polar landmark protein, partial [Pseudoalteromonas ruthenica]|uniref:FimV/HubP family polar landmark protein n=1 Tax=Pseudoalteromonas ruthenica TaxID=151081 RepID=UPI00127213CC
MRGLVTLVFVVATLVAAGTSAQSTEIRGPKGVDYGAQGRSIGPIKPTDTLWRIAAKVRPDNSVTMYQVMVALYEKNPDSFLDKNLNHMRDGAYLRIPSLNEIRTIDPAQARQKSEQDDRLWEKIKNGTLNSNEIDLVAKKTTSARQEDVEKAKTELKSELEQLKRLQGERLVELQEQFKSSVTDVEAILTENRQLKSQLEKISEQLATVKDQLDEKDAELQRQLQQILAEREAMAQQKLQQAQQEQSALEGIPTWLKLVLMMTIPALAVLGLIIFILKKRQSAKEPEPSDDDEFLPQTPAPQMQTQPEAGIDNLDLGADDDSLDDSLDDLPLDDPDDALDEPGIQLDDDDFLDQSDDILDEGGDGADDIDSLLDQDELDGLLDDDVVFDDESDAEVSQEEAVLQQNFDAPGDDISVDVPEENEPDSDILSDEDIDDLFATDDSEDESQANANGEEASDDSDEAMAALSEELADDQLEQTDAESGDDTFDIDELVDETQSEPADDDFDVDDLLEENAADEQSAEEDDLDVDSLLDEAAEAPAADADESDVDIDELIDENGADEQGAEE